MKNSLRKRMRDHRWNYVFLIPFFVLLLIFTLYPVFTILRFSFYRWDGFGELTNFVGISNYVETINEPYYWNAFGNSMVFAFSHLILQTIISLLFAIGLRDSTKSMNKIYRTLIFLPVITTTAVIGVVMTLIFSPMNGPLNIILKQIGFITRPISFLSKKNLALPTVIAINLWKNIGVSMIYWLAALQTVPDDVYESAKIDGANKWQTLSKITIPLVLPFGIVIALFAFKNGLQSFDIVSTMTGGGPAFSTDVIDLYIYRYAFNPEQGVARYGFSSAASVIYTSIIVIITIVVNKIQDKSNKALGA